jgi:hypothetical protein
MTIMKSTIQTIATALSLLFCFANAATAQNKVTWKGGAPGQETNWNCPKNWSNYRVPDEFSDVVIPDVSTTSLAAPVIKSGSFEVNSIQLLSNASLTIGQDAQLVVHNTENGFAQEGGLQLKGSLLLLDNTIGGAPKMGLAQAQEAARR